MSSASPGTSTRDHVLKRTVTPYATLAPLYDALLGESFFPQLRRVFERLIRRYGIRFASVADVACGTGIFVRYLRQCSVPVVYGVDRSPEMLRMAVATNQRNGARFLRQDFITLQLPQPVDLITCNFDSLNYLLTADDLLRALRRFHANLQPGGYLIFDMITDRSPWPGPQPHIERVTTGPGVTFVRVTRWNPRRCIQTAVVSISRNGQTQQEIHVQRGYSVIALIGLLVQAGFSPLGAHDFQTLGPAKPWTRRAVYVARKA